MSPAVCVAGGVYVASGVYVSGGVCVVHVVSVVVVGPDLHHSIRVVSTRIMLTEILISIRLWALRPLN
jgi:hypothetical protein